ncbi:unnamed protein product [Heterobilharzia americana]|nr:unnamed protein product [Heterobilharzia americana]CAH8454538.1 unnamed protein product [Heterobilharzia americana]
MLGSKKEKFASIFTRVKAMIEKGALAYEDRPLWYDVYEAFPPRVDPTYGRPCPTNTVQNILYPEDCERAAFSRSSYKMELLNMFKMTDNRSTLYNKCNDLRELYPDVSAEELLSLAKDELQKEGVVAKHKPENKINT